MHWSFWIRQVHRWLSIAFTLAALVNIVALIQKRPEAWIGILALAPLVLLLLTGLILFALPYLRGAGMARSTERESSRVR